MSMSVLSHTAFFSHLSQKQQPQAHRTGSCFTACSMSGKGGVRDKGKENEGGWGAGLGEGR